MGTKVLDFLVELKENNDRDWFKAHKQNYDEARSEFISMVENLMCPRFYPCMLLSVNPCFKDAKNPCLVVACPRWVFGKVVFNYMYCLSRIKC